MNTSLKDAECPVCFEHFLEEIYLCATGHSLCGQCLKIINYCPICSKPMKDQRNYALEGVLKQLMASRTVDIAKYSCPLDQNCEFYYRDFNSLRIHFRNSHMHKFSVCKSNKFSIRLKHKKSRVGNINAVTIFEYNEHFFKLCTKISYDTNSACFSMQMIDFKKNGYRFEVDYLHSVRRNKFSAHVSNLTKIKDAFVSSYVKIPLHLIIACSKENDIKVYGRFVDLM